MKNQDKLILVCGATGQQGSAVVRHCLERGFRVRALTRDISKPRAQELKGLGAEVVMGNMDDRLSIEKALEGCYGCFSVQNPMESGIEGEIRQGINVADACLSKKIQHLVYSSVGSANMNTGIPFFDCKVKIEQHIRSLKLPFTILRPVYFMENFQNYLREPILNGEFALPLNPNTPLQMISVDDIGNFTAMVLDNPSKFSGKEIELASDELTMTKVASIFTRILGHPVKYTQAPYEEFEKQAGPELTTMYRWMNNYGFRADIAELRSQLPQMTRFEQVLKKENWLSKVAA